MLVLRCDGRRIHEFQQSLEARRLSGLRSPYVVHMEANGQRSFTQSPSHAAQGDALSKASVFCQVQNKVPALKARLLHPSSTYSPARPGLASRKHFLKALMEKDYVLTGKPKDMCSGALDKCRSAGYDPVGSMIFFFHTSSYTQYLGRLSCTKGSVLGCWSAQCQFNTECPPHT